MSLRKQKTSEIINAKRRKLIGVYNEEITGPEHVQSQYKGFAQFEKNPEEYERLLKELCPELFGEAKT